MILKEPLKIDPQTLASLLYVKEMMLLIRKGAKFIIVKEFETEKRTEYVIKKRWLRKPITITEYNTYLTSVEMWGYSIDNRFWGTFSEESVKDLLRWYDLKTLRTNYITHIKEPLNKLGFEITKIPVHESTRN